MTKEEFLRAYKKRRQMYLHHKSQRDFQIKNDPCSYIAENCKRSKEKHFKSYYR